MKIGKLMYIIENGFTICYFDSPIYSPFVPGVFGAAQINVDIPSAKIKTMKNRAIDGFRGK